MASFLNSAGDWWNGGGKGFVGEGLSDLGYGLSNSTNIGDALGAAARQTVALQPQRDLQAEKIAAQKQQAQQLQTAIANLRDKYKRPDLADAVAQGYDVNKAWQDVLTKRAPISVSPGETLLDPNTMQPMYTSPAAAKVQGLESVAPGSTLYDPNSNRPVFTAPGGEPKAPNGFQYQPDGTLTFIPGGPADPSTAGKTTEATRRNQQLATVITPELQSLIGNGQTPGTFDALADTGNQVWNGVGLGNIATSPQYQQAQNSLKTIVASYLYSVSGATANPGEVQNQVDVLTPKPGESAQSIAAKKQRLISMVEAVKAAATGRPINIDQPAGQQGNVTSNGVQWSVEP